MSTVKKITALILVLCGLVIMSGCSKSPEQEGGKEPESVENTAPSEPKAFFDKYINTDERPIAVMIDNDDDNARPQSGLNDAYLIYEMTVEGGATRFLAVYKGTDTEKIGPVRSSRHYFLDYVMENDALYTHYGWSPKAIEDISAYSIKNLNGMVTSDVDIFWREEKFAGDWHSAYTSIEKIKNKASKKGYATDTEHKNGIEYSDSYFELSRDNPAYEVILKYSSVYTTGYSYNSETGMYEKTINGKPHVMQDGNVVEVKNIIVELIYDTSLNDGSGVRRQIDTTGTGKGYYFTGGAYEEITWSKDSRRDNTFYKKSDGTPLVINPGKTIVNIISPSSDITIE